MLYLHNILGGVWFVEENFAANYFPLIASFLTKPETMFGKPRNASSEQEPTEDNALLFASLKNGAYQISEYGGWSPPEDAPKNSVAIMNINGAITKYDQECGPSGMLTKANLLNRCYNENNIKAIVLNIDSGGGEGMGCRIMQEAINSRNKPVVAFCNDFVAADNWDKLLNKVLGDNPDMKAEDVTVDQLLDSIESTGNTSDLQEQLSTAQEELKEKDTQIEQLQSDVAELKGTPAGKKPEAKVKQEPTAETGDIKDFADKHEDDTLAIMAEAEKTGFFKH